MFLLIDLNRVCIKIIYLAPNVLNSCLLISIHRLLIFTLTTDAIIVIIFIMYLYLYLLKSLYLLEFIVAYVFAQLENIYFKCFSTLFIGLVFIADLLYLFIFIELDLIFFYSIHVL